MAALTRAVQNAHTANRSELTGRVVQVLGPHCVAVLVPYTGTGDPFDEEIVLHGPAGWTRGLRPGQSVRTTGEWAEADHRPWGTAERSRYLGIPGRLQFRVGSADAGHLQGRAAA